MGELIVERLKSYDEAVDTGDVSVLCMLWMLWFKGLDPRRAMEDERE